MLPPRQAPGIPMSIGLGLAAAAPFRVLEFRNASNHVELVIDVAHH